MLARLRLIRGLLGFVIALSPVPLAQEAASASSPIVEQSFLHIVSPGGSRAVVVRLPSMRLFWDHVRISGGKHPVAIYLEPIGKTKGAGSGVFSWSGLSQPGWPPTLIPIGLAEAQKDRKSQANSYYPGQSYDVAAGRYRIHLMSSGSLTVRIPVPSPAFAEHRTAWRETSDVLRVQNLPQDPSTPVLGSVGRGSSRLPDTGDLTRTLTVVHSHYADPTQVPASSTVETCREPDTVVTLLPCEVGESPDYGYGLSSFGDTLGRDGSRIMSAVEFAIAYYDSQPVVPSEQGAFYQTDYIVDLAQAITLVVHLR